MPLSPPRLPAKPPQLPAKPESESALAALSENPQADLALRDKAYRLLARREHSAWELRRKLQGAQPGADSGGTAGMVDELLAELARQGAQSDARYTEQRCRQYYRNGRGPLKLRHELARHHIAESLVERMMADYADKWCDLAVEVRRRKFGDLAPSSYREWAKQARFLQQRGFSTDHIEPYPG